MSILAAKTLMKRPRDPNHIHRAEPAVSSEHQNAIKRNSEDEDHDQLSQTFRT
jgi:hypothetical protein